MARIVFTPKAVTSSYKVVDEGMYWVTITGWRPKNVPDTGKGKSINFNPILELSANGDGSPAPTRDDGKPVPIFANLNSKGDWVITDFVHSFGLPMEVHPNGGESIPGIWTPEDEQDIEKCQYKGPMIGRKAQVYLVRTEYQGKPQNKIKFYVCSVPNCAQKFPKLIHSTNLLK